MSSNLLLSFELIYLMGWLLRNAQGKLKVLLEHALDNGLAAELEAAYARSENNISNQELQNTFLTFINHLEGLLTETLEKYGPQGNNVLRGKLINLLAQSTLDGIDSNNMLTALEQTEKLLSRAGTTNLEDAKDILLGELIDTWDPDQDEVVH